MDQDEMTATLAALLQRLGMAGEGDAASPAQEQLLETADLAGVVKYIKEHNCKRIVVMSGAGISTAAGIPDFRSPGTGLYHNLQRFNLPDPQAVFEIDFFRGNPKPFCILAKELYPGNFAPTMSHCFVKLLHDKGLLLRNYTQNIDTLERQAGIPGSALVEAHGSFAEGHCLSCRKSFPQEWTRERIFADTIPKCDVCDGLVKPDIVFFGEELPERFGALCKRDLQECDLLLVMGTSLQVQPFASLIDFPLSSTPRVLINRERVGEADLALRFIFGDRGFVFGGGRDAALLGSCDDVVTQLAEALGWADDLQAIYRATRRPAADVSASAADVAAAAAAAAADGVPAAPAAAPASPTAATAPVPPKDPKLIEVDD